MKPRFHIVYRDRATGDLRVERVYAERFLYWLYNTWPGAVANALVFRRRPFSALYGRLQRAKWSQRRIRRFVEALGMDLSEAKIGPEGFRSFQEFFTRKIDLSRRPIDPDPDAVVAAADGKLLVYPEVDPSQPFRVKRSLLDLERCLGDRRLAERYAGGALVVQRLTLGDYHHFHFPVAGVPGEPRFVPGRYDAGGPYSLGRLVPFYGGNHRAVTLLETERFGRVVLVEIGAMTVGTIRQCFRPGAYVEKGERKGHFELGGSTVLLGFEPGAIQLEEDLCASTREDIESYVRLGERIARRSGEGR